MNVQNGAGGSRAKQGNQNVQRCGKKRWLPQKGGWEGTTLRQRRQTKSINVVVTKVTRIIPILSQVKTRDKTRSKSWQSIAWVHQVPTTARGTGPTTES